MTDQPSVQHAIAAIIKDVSPVGKDSVNEQQRFKFRGVDALVNAISPLLGKHGVSVVPTNVTIIDTSERATKSGGAMFHVVALFDYRIYGPGGDWVPAQMSTEALDTSDKAMSKLATQAYKYILAQVFAVPFAGVDDPDLVTHERQAIPPAEASIARITELAASQDQDIETFSARFRKRRGGMTVDQFLALDDHTLASFVTAVEQYLATKEA